MRPYLIESISCLLPTILVLIIYTLISEKKRLKGQVYIPKTHYIGVWGLSIYLTLIFAYTISPVYGFSLEPSPVINLIPFKEWMKANGEGITSAEKLRIIRSVVIKMMLFVPFGFLLPFLWKRYKKLYRVALSGFYLSVTIELFQLFLLRTTDVDDIINNTIGTLIGFLIFCFLQRWIKQVGKLATIKKKNGIKLSRFLRYESEIVILFTLSMTVLVGFSRYTILPNSNLEKMVEFNNGGKNHKQTDFFSGTEEEYLQEHQTDQLEETVLTERRNLGVMQLPLSASNAILINMEKNQILYKKNSDEKIYPASTTKLVTALTVLKYCRLDEVVQVGEEVNYVAIDASKAGLYKGQVLTIKMLLEGLLLPSGNDAAYVLATYTGKKLKGEGLSNKEAISYFITKMNETIQQYGATHSYFLNPDGYDQQGQYTTAYDLAIIGKVCLENSVIKDIVRQYSISESSIDGTAMTWNSSNELLDEKSNYYYPYAIGLKTGSTEGAGRCVVSAATFKGETYISVVMNSTEEGRWKDSICLLDFGRRNPLGKDNWAKF